MTTMRLIRCGRSFECRAGRPTRCGRHPATGGEKACCVPNRWWNQTGQLIKIVVESRSLAYGWQMSLRETTRLLASCASAKHFDREPGRASEGNGVRKPSAAIKGIPSWSRPFLSAERFMGTANPSASPTAPIGAAEMSK